jgi:succinate-semialdehyde dehydrogenase/glutarate-semialdehyde dehydrogenase
VLLRSFWLLRDDPKSAFPEMAYVSPRLLSRLRDPSLLRLNLPATSSLFAVRDPSRALRQALDQRAAAGGNVVAELPNFSVADALGAVDAARQAQTAWGATLAKERAAVLRQAAALQRANAVDLGTILAVESGKPLDEAVGEVEYGAAYLEWFGEEAKRIDGTIPPAQYPNRTVLVTRRAVGVAALLTPFNFPNAMLCRKIGAAFASGCAAVCRPSESTPLSTIALANVFAKAGAPPGVMNVLTSASEGAGPISKALCESEHVRVVSFTGSTKVGKELVRQCASTLKRTAMELGGNAPFIVFSDADLGVAVQAAVHSKFRFGGQTCISPNRFYVQHEVYDEFCDRFASQVSALRVGPALDKGVQMGCMIHERALERVENVVKQDVLKGAQLLCGGRRLVEIGELFYAPTVLKNATLDMTSMCLETFGPVAPCSKFHTEDEVVREANATEFGLAAYVFSRDLGTVMRVTRQLEFGMIGVNTGVLSAESAPFGGIKSSGFGREGSRLGVEDFTDVIQVALSF